MVIASLVTLETNKKQLLRDPQFLSPGYSLKTLVVPSNVVYWTCSTLVSILIPSVNFSNLAVTARNAPASTEIIIVFSIPHIWAISSFGGLIFHSLYSSLSHPLALQDQQL